MAWPKSALAKVLLAVAAVVILIIARFVSVSDIASESVELQLRQLGGSIYEYHTITGRWPSSADDLALTSLSVKSPYWRMLLDIKTDVVVWHNDLNPDPRANVGVILAYHNRGLLGSLGWQWVCWGDLRTEYISTRRLHALLRDARQ